MRSSSRAGWGQFAQRFNSCNWPGWAAPPQPACPQLGQKRRARAMGNWRWRACAGEGQADVAHAHYAPYKTRRIWANQTWPWGECLSSGLEWEMSIREFDFSSDVLNVTFDYHIIFNTDCWQNKISLLQWWNCLSGLCNEHSWPWSFTDPLSQQ